MKIRLVTVLGFIMLAVVLAPALWSQITPDTPEQKKDRLVQEYLDKQKKKKPTPTKPGQTPTTTARPKSADYRSPYILKDSLKSADSRDSLTERAIDTLPDSLLDSLAYDFMASDTLPDTLVPFGYEMFNIEPDLALPADVAGMADYILGPGDNIFLFLWGKVEQEYDLTIDREGNVFIPKVGEVTAWGLTVAEFEKQLKEKLSRVYTDFRVSISLGEIRSIRVYLTGEVKKPGAYTVSSLATVFNAMYLAGGPTSKGSLRNVKLLRSNQVEKTVDFYDFLLKGDNQGDVRMNSGDVVFVPVTGIRAAIDGEVMRPAIYELKEGETVGDLVAMAGGLTAMGYLGSLTLERYSPANEKITLDLNLDSTLGPVDNFALHNGDSVVVHSVFDLNRNWVAVAGMVKNAHRFERTDSQTARELLLLAELQPQNVHYDRANIFRTFPDLRMEIIPFNVNQVLNGEQNIYLQDMDSLHIYSIEEITRKKYVFIEGEVKNPGAYPWMENMSLSDLIFLAGDLTKIAYHLNIELARTETTGQVSVFRYDRFDPESENIILQEDDFVFVREIPDLFLHQLITVEGEVRFPGQYALLSRNETLFDIITRAGGFTERAFPKGIIFYRPTIGEALIRQNLPEIISRNQPVREDSLGNIKRQELFKFSQDNVNRMIIDVAKLVESSGKAGNITLQGDDYIYVPKIPSGISVMGAVGAEGTIKYEGGKKVRYYVERAGNFSRQADRGAVRLIRADGRVYSGGGTLGKKVELGDAIVVPTEIKRDRDWLRTLSTVFTIVSGALTTILVIDRL